MLPTTLNGSNNRFSHTQDRHCQINRHHQQQWIRRMTTKPSPQTSRLGMNRESRSSVGSLYLDMAGIAATCVIAPGSHGHDGAVVRESEGVTELIMSSSSAKRRYQWLPCIGFPLKDIKSAGIMPLTLSARLAHPTQCP